MTLLNDMPQQASDVLDATPLDIKVVMVIGVDSDGDLYVDANTECPDCMQKMLFGALGQLKASLD